MQYVQLNFKDIAPLQRKSFEWAKGCFNSIFQIKLDNLDFKNRFICLKSSDWRKIKEKEKEYLNESADYLNNNLIYTEKLAQEFQVISGDIKKAKIAHLSDTELLRMIDMFLKHQASIICWFTYLDVLKSIHEESLDIPEKKIPSFIEEIKSSIMNTKKQEYQLRTKIINEIEGDSELKKLFLKDPEVVIDWLPICDGSLHMRLIKHHEKFSWLFSPLTCDEPFTRHDLILLVQETLHLKTRESYREHTLQSIKSMYNISDQKSIILTRLGDICRMKVFLLESIEYGEFYLKKILIEIAYRKKLSFSSLIKKEYSQIKGLLKKQGSKLRKKEPIRSLYSSSGQTDDIIEIVVE